MSAADWWGYSIASVILLLILGGMYLLIRVMSDDSGKFEELRAMLDPLFHPPAFLQPGASDQAQSSGDHEASRTANVSSEPFEEACPGCGEQVTHVHAECPSCGLRLY